MLGKNRVLISSIFIIVTISFLIFRADSVNSIQIFGPEEKPYGLAYEDHAKNWWKWLLSMPIDINPTNDKTGDRCINGQQNSNSSLFYLAGGGGGLFERTCEVPYGKGILMPLMVVEVSDKEAPQATLEDLKKIAKNDQDHVTSLYIKLNDKEYKYQDLIKYRINTTDIFEVFFPKNAMYGVSEGPSKASADGFYIITKPLPKGEHIVQFKSSLFCPGENCLDVNWAQDVKYKLIVK
jgi:hypothetical protein